MTKIYYFRTKIFMKVFFRLMIIADVFSVLITPGCLQKVKPASEEELLAVDRAFSELSADKGMKHAFLEYAADNVVMLRKNKLPVEGKNALAVHFTTFSDTGFVLTWEPLFADIAMSGDLGYTYGIYTSLNHTKDGSKTESRGTYVSIWRKDNSGNWKFVLDSGNEGTGEQ